MMQTAEMARTKVMVRMTSVDANEILGFCLGMIFIFKDIIVVVLLNMSESSKLEQGSQGEEQELDSEQESQGEELDQEPEQEQELDSEQGSQGEELDQEPEQDQEPEPELDSEQDQEPEPELDSEQDQEPEPDSEQGSQGDESDKEQPGGGAPQIAKRKIFILHRWRIVHRYGRFLYVNVKGRLVRLSQIKSMKTKTNKASCSKRAKNTCS
jgi:hypothetical protein